MALADGEWLMPGDLFPDARRQTGESADRVQPLSLAAARDAAEKREIERALRRSSGQIGEAAKLLGISRTTLVGPDAPFRHGAEDQADRGIPFGFLNVRQRSRSPIRTARPRLVAEAAQFAFDISRRTRGGTVRALGGAIAAQQAEGGQPVKRCQMMVDAGRRKFLSGAGLAAAGAAAATVVPSRPRAPRHRLGWIIPRIGSPTSRDLKPNEPLNVAYPDQDAPGVLLKLGKRVPSGVGPDGDIVGFSTSARTRDFRSATTSPITP